MFYNCTLAIGTGSGELFFLDVSKFWSGVVSYFRVFYGFPSKCFSSEECPKKQYLQKSNVYFLNKYVDPLRDYLEYSSQNREDIEDKMNGRNDYEALLGSVNIFDRPLSETFYALPKQLCENDDEETIKNVKNYYEILDSQVSLDSDKVQEYECRKITPFEGMALLDAANERYRVANCDTSLAVYAHCYNPRTGKLFMVGGGLTSANEEAACCLFH